MKSKVITPLEEDYSQWYIDIVTKAQLADYAPVKGCMVIRPRGYAIWEKIQATLDRMFKETGHKNAYFPLFIPASFLEKEADHIEGFAPQCAVVTQGGGKKLEEPLIVRPTSETIIWSMYGKWIKSWRDLPILINQWANIVRWEMRTRLFLRTTEFLWQEGHTAHATEAEAETEALKMLEVYKTFAENYMAMPVVAGQKTESEKFAGAVRTYSIEAMMKDRKALQAGTSHNLGQNFAKAFNVTFQDKDGELKYVYASSWGVSTRLIGALIMVHSDNKGLVLPPLLASTELVIVPIWKSEEEKAVVLEWVYKLHKMLKDDFSVELDIRDEYTPGWKFAEWELLGIPIRVEIGPKDIQKEAVVLVRRDTGEKEICPLKEILPKVRETLKNIQSSLYDKALRFREENTFYLNNYKDFLELFESKGGFVKAYWCGDEKCEKEVQEETKVSIRCIPFEQPQGKGVCIKCGRKATLQVLFAKSY